MNKTKIPYADYTCNPITGCTEISEGCANCYAREMTNRFKDTWGDFGIVRSRPERLKEIDKIKKPSRIFLCSMSDIYHENVSPFWREEIIEKIKQNEQHAFLMLTKRAERLACYESLPKNVWLGVTVENQKRADERIPLLMGCTASIRWLSVEPLLERVNLHLDKYPVDWVVCGGESGKNARPCIREWIANVYNQCRAANIPFYFKQWGSNPISPIDDFDYLTGVREYPKEVKNA